MTGFARTEGHADGCSWTVEIKSVNGRNLDIRFRLPSGYESLETACRSDIARRFKRGSLTVTITLARTESASQFRVNRPLLDQLLTLAGELASRGAAPPRADGLLAIRGVIEPVEDGLAVNREQTEALLLADLNRALDRLAVARAGEGARLGEILTRHLDDIAALVHEAGACAATQPVFLRDRLCAQLAALSANVPALSEERLAQEVAVLVARGDIREELDRLRAHLEAARDLLAAGDAVGRRLDFLCQEFHRETNTLCAKSSDVELTRIGLALKATIEQLREQIQNIE